MAYIFAKQNSLLIAALGASLFAGYGIAAQTQGSTGQSGQSTPSSQSQSGQSGAAEPGVAHSSEDGKSSDSEKDKSKTSSSKKNASTKKSKKDTKASKNADAKNSDSKDSKDSKGKKTASAKSSRSKRGAAEKGANAAKGGKVDTEASAEPDKVLYDRAMADVKKSRYTEGRLSLQTLINTYPDSEYLAKAKLAVADSYFKEGGTSNLTQSIQEYVDFQTFFPFLDEAAYAQMQVGMAHYKMMEKSDRDNSQALGAEDAFQTFLLKYPANPLAPQAEQHLREVQEVLADGQFRIAHFYYVKQDMRAAAARLIEVTDRYPLYSGSDEALWMLGNVYTKAKTVSKNEDDKNHWADLAGKCYSRIVRDYPLSRYSGDAKARLGSMGMPVPAADPNAVARMQKDQLYAKEHRQNAVKRVPMSMLKSNPDVSSSAHSGAPNLNPPTDTISATEVLKPGAAGPGFGIAVGASAEGRSVGDAASGGETVAPAAPSGSGTGMGVQIISTGGATNVDSSAAAPAAPSQPQMEGQVLNPSSSNAPSVNPSVPPSASPTTNPPASTAPSTSPAPNPSASASSAPAGGTSTSGTDGSSTTPGSQPSASGTSDSQQQRSSGDPKQESSSKKKKGVKKLIPF